MCWIILNLSKKKTILITRLNRIKKIARHRKRNGTDTPEKCLKFQEFWCISWPPENSSSREIFISSFRHFKSKFGCYFTKVPWNFDVEQISTFASEIWFVFVGKIKQNIFNQEKNRPFWRKKLWSHQNYQAVSKDTRKKSLENETYIFKL
jgi:hypothetical protein